MTKLFFAASACLILIGVTISGRAQEVVIVPGLVSDATFIKAEGDSSRTATFTAVGGDGASALVAGEILISALEGSRFSVGHTEDGKPIARIEAGSFKVTAGSKKAELLVSDKVLTALEADLSIVESNGTFLVRFDSRYKSKGRVELAASKPGKKAPVVPKSTDGPKVPMTSEAPNYEPVTPAEDTAAEGYLPEDPYADVTDGKETESKSREVLTNLSDEERKKLEKKRRREARSLEKEQKREARKLEKEQKREERRLKKERRRAERRLERERKKEARELKKLEKTPPKLAPAPVKIVAKKDVLFVGQAMVLEDGTPPKEAAYHYHRVFEENVRGANPPESSGSKLVAQDVEQETDLVAKMMDSEEAFADIEIEDIEVEAGCVEVCLD